MGAAGCCFVLLAGHVWIPLHAIMGEVCCRGLACHHSLVMTLPSCDTEGPCSCSTTQILAVWRQGTRHEHADLCHTRHSAAVQLSLCSCRAYSILAVWIPRLRTARRVVYWQGTRNTNAHSCCVDNITSCPCPGPPLHERLTRCASCAVSPCPRVLVSQDRTPKHAVHGWFPIINADEQIGSGVLQRAGLRLPQNHSTVPSSSPSPFSRTGLEPL